MISKLRADFAVLAWRDVHIIRNSARRIFEEPIRLIGWTLWLAYLAYCLFLRGHGRPVSADSAAIALDVGATIFLLVMSLSFLHGEMPPAPFFESVTEARFLTTSQVAPWMISVYFQFRNALRRFPSMAIFLAYILTLEPLRYHDPFSLVISLTTILGTLFLSRVFSLPREFSSGAMRVICMGFGSCALAIALFSGLQIIATLVPTDHPSFGLPLHLGRVFVLGTQRNYATALCVYAANGIAFVWGALATRGKYPELYSLSVDGWNFRRRLREGERRSGFAGLRKKPESAPAAMPPSLLNGPAIALWMNWLMFRRTMPGWWIILRPFVAFALGFIAVYMVGDIVTVLRAFGIVIGLTILTTAVTDATRIGKELRQPLFWLTDHALAARLFVSVFGWYWRSAADLILFFSGAFIAGKHILEICTILSLALSAVWLQRCISAASFAIVPSNADLGGPIFLARMIFTIACSVPPGVAGMVIFTQTHNVGWAAIVGCGLALIESYALLRFAAQRLAGRFDRILGY